MAQRDDGEEAALKQFGVDEATRTIMQRKSSNGESGGKSNRKKATKNLPQATEDAMEFLLASNNTSPSKLKATLSPIRPTLSKTASETEEFSTPLSGDMAPKVDDIPPLLDLNDANVDETVSGGAFAEIPELEDVFTGPNGTLGEVSMGLNILPTADEATKGPSPDVISMQMVQSANKSGSDNSSTEASPNTVPVAKRSTSKSSKKKKNKANKQQNGVSPDATGSTAAVMQIAKAEPAVTAVNPPEDAPEPGEMVVEAPFEAPLEVQNAVEDEFILAHGQAAPQEDYMHLEEETKVDTPAASASIALESSTMSASERLAKDWEFKHALPADLNPLVLKIDEFKKSFAAPSAVPLNVDGGHVRFRITRSLTTDSNLASQSVFRRFRDFQALSLRLKHCFPFKVIPALPSVTILSRMVMSEEEFLNLRARRLEAFLYSMLRDQRTLWKSPDVQAFLLKESEEFDEMAVKYIKNAGQDLDVPPAAVTEKLLSNSFSYLLRFVGNAPSPPGTAAPVSPQVMKDDLESAVTPVSQYKDKGEDKDRAAMFEHLTECLEQHLSLSRSKSALLDELHSALDDVVGFAGLGEAAFDSTTESHFAHGLVREPRPVGESLQLQGALRSSHQCAALLGGMTEMLQSATASVEQGSVKESDVDEFKSEVNRVKRTVSALGTDLAMQFTMESLHKASHERQRLEQTLKDAVLFQ